MRILFDQGTPAPLRLEFAGHNVDLVFELGWSNLQNGDLLDAAEAAGYEAFVTMDQQLQYQQNRTNRRIAILVLGSTSWPKIQKCVDAIRSAIMSMTAGSYVEVSI